MSIVRFWPKLPVNKLAELAAPLARVVSFTGVAGHFYDRPQLAAYRQSELSKEHFKEQHARRKQR